MARYGNYTIKITIAMAMLLYKRLKARGWVFAAAHEKIRSQPRQNRKPPPEPLPNREQIILHSEYHPDDIPRKKGSEIWSEHCEDLF